MADGANIPDVVDLSIERIRQGLEDREFTCLELCEVSNLAAAVLFHFRLFMDADLNRCIWPESPRSTTTCMLSSRRTRTRRTSLRLAMRIMRAELLAGKRGLIIPTPTPRRDCALTSSPAELYMEFQFS